MSFKSMHINYIMHKLIKLTVLEEQINNCKLCKLHENRILGVPGEINILARVCFVGEAPGEKENVKGCPFIGKSGQFLRKFINDAKLTCSILNTVKCYVGIGNPDPPPDCVEKCFYYLKEQINIIRPKIIIATGKVALASLLDKPKEEIHISDYVNKIWRSPKFDIPVLAIFHPRYAMSAGLRKEYWESFKKIQKILTAQR
jgi:DNA polymerase